MCVCAGSYTYMGVRSMDYQCNILDTLKCVYVQIVIHTGM